MSVRDLLRDCRPTVHEVTVNGKTFFVKSLSGEGRQSFSEMSKEKDGSLPVQMIAALGLCEQDGSMCFDCSTEKGRILANVELKEVDGAVLQAIALKLLQVSGLSKDSAGDAEKKSEASQSD